MADWERIATELLCVGLFMFGLWYKWRRGQPSNAELLQSFLDNAQIGMMAFRAIRDRRGRIIDFQCTLQNRYAVEKGPGHKIVGKRLLQELPAHQETGLFEQYCQSAAGKELTREFYFPGLGWFENRSFPLPGGFGVTFSNITALRDMALTDPLTGLGNRYSLRSHQGCDAVLYLDLDGFKRVNDDRGHDTGDALLQQVASRIQSATQEEDTLIRYGGDEFLILLGRAKSEDVAMEAARAIEAEITKPYSMGSEQLDVGVSIGVCPARGASLATAIKRADAALMARKKARRSNRPLPPVVLIHASSGAGHNRFSPVRK